MAILLGSAYGRIDIDARGVQSGVNVARNALLEPARAVPVYGELGSEQFRCG